MDPFIGLFVGAFLGALFGWGFAIYQQKRQAVAKRAFLERSLREVLGMIAPSVGAYRVEKASHRDPVHLAALPHLLDSDVLDFTKDTELIRGLLRLQATVSNYNAFIRVFSNAQAVSVIPDNVHAQMHQTMKRYHSAMIEARDVVLGHIQPG